MSEISSKLTNTSVIVVAYDGLCTFEFGVATELFGLPRPELEVDWYHFEVVSVDPAPLRTLGGITLDAPVDLGRITQAGTIVLPGWRNIAEQPPVALLEALVAAHSNGARIMSICSGVFILAASGLLDGRSATTHWRYTDALQQRFPHIDVRPDVLYVDNGSLLTSAGSAAGLDLGLHLIRRDFGTAVANTVARRLVVAPHRDGGQAQFITTPVPSIDADSLSPTLDWAKGNLDRPLTVAELAQHAALSERTFARRFSNEVGMSPHQWVTRQRVLHAQQLLEQSNHPIDIVAASCGFGSAATLRHHFNHQVHTTPSRYRARFHEAS